MNLTARLFWRDLRSGRLLVLFLSIVVATATVTGISIGVARFAAALTSESSVLLGADMRLRSAAAVPEEWMAAAAGLGLATSRTLRFPSMLFANDNLALGAVKAAGDRYPLRGALATSDTPFTEGAVTDSLPAPGETWLDSRLFALLGVGIGDTVEIGDAAFTVTKVLTAEPDPGGGMELLSPRALIRIVDAERTGVLKPGSRLRWSYLVAGDAEARRRWRAMLTPRLGAGQRLDEVGNMQSTVGEALARVERFLLLAGSLAVLLAGLAIAVAARHYTAAHYDQVAILKTLGAGIRRIRILYLAGFAVLVAAAIATGWGAGWGVQEAVVALFADNIRFTLPAPGARPFIAGAATALLGFFIFAWPPLWRLERASPLRVLRRDFPPGGRRPWLEPLLGVAGAAALVWWSAGDALVALSLVGIGGGVAGVIGGGAFVALGFRFAAGNGRLRLALASLRRDRLLNSVHALVFGAAIMLVLLLAVVRSGLVAQWQTQLPPDSHNHFLVNISPDERDALTARLDRLGLARSAMRPVARGRLVGHDKTAGRRAQAEPLPRWNFMLSWSDAAAPPGDDELTAGRWFAPGGGGVSVDEEFADDHDVRIGDTLHFDLAGATVTAAVQSLRKVNWQRIAPGFTFVFAPEVLRDAPHVFMTSFHLPAARGGELVPLMRDFPTVSVLEVERLLSRVRVILDRAGTAVELMLALVAAAGALVLVAGIRYSMAARRRQTALLRALGASRRLLLGALAVEFALLGLLAGAIAAIGAEAAGAVLQVQVFDLDYRAYPWLWLAGPLLGTAVVTLLGLAASRRVLAVSPLRVLL